MYGRVLKKGEMREVSLASGPYARLIGRSMHVGNYVWMVSPWCRTIHTCRLRILRGGLCTFVGSVLAPMQCVSSLRPLVRSLCAFEPRDRVITRDGLYALLRTSSSSLEFFDCHLSLEVCLT